jgi:hypothetical protein
MYAALSLSATTGVQGNWAREQSHSLKRQHLAVVPRPFVIGSKKGATVGETVAPNKRRQLQGVRGTGADGSTCLTLLGLLRSRLSSYLAAVDCRCSTRLWNKEINLFELPSWQLQPWELCGTGNVGSRAILPQFGGIK